MFDKVGLNEHPCFTPVAEPEIVSYATVSLNAVVAVRTYRWGIGRVRDKDNRRGSVNNTHQPRPD